MLDKPVAVIPARMGSERLPGKPLRLLGDKPLIRWVYEAAQKSDLFRKIIVLTDSIEISRCVEGFGGSSFLTPVDCNSGTERILTVREKLEGNIIVNIQGDEPFIDKGSLTRLIRVFDNPEIGLASLMQRASYTEELHDPNIVKVTVDRENSALYFSRALIPHCRTENNRDNISYFKHIGIYAYRKTLLDSLALMQPGKLEAIENLEQLRWLENGLKIRMVETDYNGWGIDTAEDLLKAEEKISMKEPRSK